MAMFKKTGIVGTGLIGGSIGLDLKKRNISLQVVGTSRHQASLSEALRIGAIDKGSLHPSILSGCDLVVFATPVETIINQAHRFKQYIPADCIVIDVASAKGLVVRTLNGFFKRYVGCHPLAGSEKRGIAHATEGLFQDTICIITPIKDTEPSALASVKQFWARLGAIPRVMRLHTMTEYLHTPAIFRTL